MATQAEYLVNNTANDGITLLQQLLAVRTIVTRIVERMEGIYMTDQTMLDDYPFPNDYTKTDFVALYNALDNLPGSIVEDGVRNKLLKLVSCIQ